MAEPCETSSLSHPFAEANRKPVVVRVKRKANQERLDALWLEINERPLKRPLLDLERLSFSDSSGKVEEESGTKKLLVQHVETISHSAAVKEVLQSFLPDSSGSMEFRRKINDRRSTLKQNKRKQDRLLSTARQEHEDLVRSARFKQIWRSRKGGMELDDDSLREICHLYDVVRVDVEDENSGKVQEPEQVPVEDNAILCNYLPLLREFLPLAAEGIESDMMAYTSNEDNYVYDLYTVEDGSNGNEEDTSTKYPLVQVNDDDEYYDSPLQSDTETDDSNAENNERNDYPEEESSGDEERKNLDPFIDFDGYDSQYEEEIVDEAEDEENRRWGYR